MKNRSLVLILILIAIIAIFAYAVYISGSKSQINSTQEIIIKNSGGSALLIAECTNKSYLYENSDIIANGRVEGIETKQEGGQIYTYSIFHVDFFEKGVLSSNNLAIKTSGGCVGETCTVVEDQPIMHENESVRIYLKETDNEFSIFCGIAGIELVEKLSIDIS
jgi:hypothetical protein